MIIIILGYRGPRKLCEIRGESHFFAFLSLKIISHFFHHLISLYDKHKTKTDPELQGVYLVPSEIGKISNV